MKLTTPTQRFMAALSRAMPSVGALFCLIVSLVGVGVSSFLTIIKFRMSYTPFLTEHGGCGFSGMTCDDALTSSPSTLLALPLSLWSAAFYLVMGFLSGALVWRRTALGGLAPHLLVASAYFAVLLSLILGTYAFTFLDSPCPYCITLYAVSALLLAGALVTRNPPGSARGPKWSEIRRYHLPAAFDAAFVVTLLFVVVVGVQAMTYHGMRNFVDSQLGMPEAAESLPLTKLRLGDDAPKAIIVMFLDMSCHKCRSEFKALAGALRDQTFPAAVQLWIYHTPRQACDLAAFPGGYIKSDDGVRFDNPCLAARAVECLTELRPSTDPGLLLGIFALQDDRQKDTPLFTATRIADRAVDLGIEIDPDDADNELFHCIDHDLQVLARITEHQRYAEDPKFKLPTLAVYRAIDGEPDISHGALYGDANTPLTSIFDFVKLQSASTGYPAR